MKNLLIILLFSCLTCSSSFSQADSSALFDLSMTEEFKGVVASADKVFALSEDNRGFKVYSFDREDLKSLGTKEIEDKVGKANLEYFASIMLGDDVFFLFRGYDRKTDLDGIYAYSPEGGQQLPKFWVGFPERAMKPGTIKVKTTPRSDILSLIYIPDLTSTQNQRTYFATVRNGSVLTKYHHTYEHSGELMQYEDFVPDEQGGLWVTARYYSDKDYVEERYIGEEKAFKAVLLQIPAGKEELVTHKLECEQGFLHDSKIINKSKGEGLIVFLHSKNHTAKSNGWWAMSVDMGSGGVSLRLKKEFTKELVDSMKTTKITQVMSGKKDYPKDENNGLYGVVVSDIFVVDDRILPVLEEKRWINHSEGGGNIMSTGAGSASTYEDKDYFFYGAIITLNSVDDDFALTNREERLPEKEFEGFSSRSHFHNGELEVYFPQDKELHKFTVNDSSSVDEVITIFENPKVTPTPTLLWNTGDGTLFTVRRDRKKFKILCFH